MFFSYAGNIFSYVGIIFSYVGIISGMLMILYFLYGGKWQETTFYKYTSNVRYPHENGTPNTMQADTPFLHGG